MNQCGFYNRYLLSGELPYVVMSWWHGKGRRRQKSFIPRGALLEALTKGLCQEAKRLYARRSRKRMAALERQLDERRRAEVPNFAPSAPRVRLPGSDHGRG
jgi:hypothetical protein